MYTYFGTNKFIGPPTITKQCGRGGKGLKIVNTLELNNHSQVEIIVECEHGQRKIRWSRRFQPCKQCAAKAGAYNTSPKGRVITWGNKISKAKQGVRLTKDHKKALSIAHYKTTEENWPGFYEKSEIHQLRDSLEYQTFRRSVMIRDNFTCQITGKQGKLVVHHIEAVSLNKNKIFDLNNGITLLKEVHDAFHTKYGRGYNTREQLEEFINTFDTINI